MPSICCARSCSYRNGLRARGSLMPPARLTPPFPACYLRSMLKSKGKEEGGSKSGAAKAAPRIFRTGASRGTHIRALRAALVAILEGLPDAPNFRRVTLRDYVAELDRAYPEYALNDVDLAQAVAEMDGEAHETY